MNTEMLHIAHSSDASTKALRATGARLKEMVGIDGATILDLIEAIYRQNGWDGTRRRFALEGAGITTLEQLEVHVDEALCNPPPENPWVEYELKGARKSKTLGHHFGFSELPEEMRSRRYEEAAPSPSVD